MRFMTFIKSLGEDPNTPHLDNDPDHITKQNVELVSIELHRDLHELSFKKSEKITTFDNNDVLNGCQISVFGQSRNQVRVGLVSKGWHVAQYRTSLPEEQGFTFLMKNDKVIVIKPTDDFATTIFIPVTHHVQVKAFDDRQPDAGPIK